MTKFARFALYAAILPLAGLAQTVILYPAPRVDLPTTIDGNSPSFWNESGLNLFSSTGDPEMISVATNLEGPWVSQVVGLQDGQHKPLWVESAWRDEDGTIFGWYHHEPKDVCSNGLTSPAIGAVMSRDGGKTLIDLGLVLQSGVPANCDAQNGFFAGGHGDFSVVLDREGRYFYFFFTNYAGTDSEQGIATARLAFEDRFEPSGKVLKYLNGAWEEPGLGGRMSAIFPVARAWQHEDTDSFWGPSVHYNTALGQYVMLLNHACCAPGWPQEGVYLSIAFDPANPTAWTRPQRILEGEAIEKRPGFYPQVMGMGAGETDSLAGEWARLFVHGVSHWKLYFSPDSPVVDHEDCSISGCAGVSGGAPARVLTPGGR